MLKNICTYMATNELLYIDNRKVSSLLYFILPLVYISYPATVFGVLQYCIVIYLCTLHMQSVASFWLSTLKFYLSWRFTENMKKHFKLLESRSLTKYKKLLKSLDNKGLLEGPHWLFPHDTIITQYLASSNHFFASNAAVFLIRF